MDDVRIKGRAGIGGFRKFQLSYTNLLGERHHFGCDSYGEAAAHIAFQIEVEETTRVHVPEIDEKPNPMDEPAMLGQMYFAIRMIRQYGTRRFNSREEALSASKIDRQMALDAGLNPNLIYGFAPSDNRRREGWECISCGPLDDDEAKEKPRHKVCARCCRELPPQ